MDHNLEDTMNLDVGMVDFVHSDETVVNQDDILTSSHDTEIPMEFQPIDEQQMLMETGGEEVIVPELMDHQFTLSTDTEYTVQDSQLIETSVASVNLDHTSLLTSHSDTLMDLQFESQSLLRPENIKLQPQVYTIKPANPVRAVASTPRPVAIAPKPYPKPSAKTIQYGNTKQFAIAPKPVTMMTKGAGGVTKKISLSSMVQGAKGGSVLAQIGKQLVMVPASSSQKIKLIAGSSGSSVQAQMISSKNIAGQINKQNVIKVQNSDLNQPAVLTKLSQKGTLSPPRFLMHPKISMANKVLMSPTKPIVSFGKPKQIVTIPNSPGKIMSTGQQGTLKKIVISGSTAQSMGLKAAIPQKPKPVIKAQGTIVKLTEEQKSQIHQMPGKKMQYRIRLVSPSSTLANKEQLQPQLAPQPQPQPAPQPQLRPAEPQPKTKTLVQVPSKTFLVTDGKGNIIEMTNKIPASQQSLIVSSGNSTVTKVMSKPKKTVLRLSSVGSTSLQSMPVVRSPQSLLAPITPDVPVLAPSEKNKPVQQSLLAHAAVAKCETVEEVTELHVERQSSPYLDENTNSADNVSDAIQSDPPLIVVPSYTDQQEQAHSDQHALLDAGNFEDARITTTFLPERSPSASPRASRLDSDESAAPGDQQTYSENELDSRPRKACNCTKSQCLKLYCDCFANGEFCNRCNCNNCHNNLDNEELRQKAIRGCLDRNPNAFRPKIGKSKSTGPELIRRHNKGCNCKRSGCLKNYCECYEAKIACTAMCKCVGCRNVEESLERARRREPAERRVLRPSLVDSQPRPPPPQTLKQPCSFMTTEVIEAVCQCLLAAASEDNSERGPEKADPISDVIGEFARCLQDIISAPDGTRSRDDNIIP